MPDLIPSSSPQPNGVPHLGNDELTVLAIADTGQYMIPIGRWQPAVLSLNEKGYLIKLDDVNYVITEAGRKALRADADHDLRAIQETGRKVQHTQARAIARIEQAAKLLADAAIESATATGDSRERALREWGRICLNKAAELIG
jgi:hypothetical protein